MAKYVIGEMDHASAEIKSWASENIDTLNDKMENLKKMVNDQTNSGELLDSIKHYASFNVSGINSFVNGVDVLNTNFGKATADYKGRVGQDIDTELLNTKINETQQLIDNLNDQLVSLPKNDPITPLKSFNLQRNINSAERLKTSYLDLIKKFNDWNGDHANDLKGACNIISNAEKVLNDLGSVSFDSKTGYKLDEVNYDGLSLLESESINELLLSKEYITKNGDITDEGYKFLETAFNDKTKLNERTLAMSTKMILYVDSEEELEKVLHLGYCNISSKEWDKMNKRWVYKYKPSDNFQTAVLAAQLTLSTDIKFNSSNYSDADRENINTKMMYTLSMSQTISKFDEVHITMFDVSKKGKNKITVGGWNLKDAYNEISTENIGYGNTAANNEQYEHLDALAKKTSDENMELLLSTVLMLSSGGVAIAAKFVDTASIGYQATKTTVKYVSKLNSLRKYFSDSKSEDKPVNLFIDVSYKVENDNISGEIIKDFDLQGFSDGSDAYATYIPRNNFEAQIANYNAIVDNGGADYGLEHLSVDDFYNNPQKVYDNIELLNDKNNDLDHKADGNPELRTAITNFGGKDEGNE